MWKLFIVFDSLNKIRASMTYYRWDISCVQTIDKLNKIKNRKRRMLFCIFIELQNYAIRLQIFVRRCLTRQVSIGGILGIFSPLLNIKTRNSNGNGLIEKPRSTCWFLLISIVAYKVWKVSHQGFPRPVYLSNRWSGLYNYQHVEIKGNILCLLIYMQK